MDFVKATRRYEQWLGHRTKLVQPDLRLKHSSMKQGVFPFLRATYYRWAQSRISRAARVRKFLQGRQSDSPVAVVGQSPAQCTIVAEPEVLNGPLLPASRGESRRNFLSARGDAVEFQQKELTVSEFQKGLSTL